MIFVVLFFIFKVETKFPIAGGILTGGASEFLENVSNIVIHKTSTKIIFFFCKNFQFLLFKFFCYIFPLWHNRLVHTHHFHQPFDMFCWIMIFTIVSRTKVELATWVRFSVFLSLHFFRFSFCFFLMTWNMIFYRLPEPSRTK